VKKILVIRFSSIGDIVLTSPVVRCLKKQLNAEVHFLTKRSYAGLVTNNPYVDKVWTIDKQVSEVLPDLKKVGFDFIVDLHKNLRTQQVKFGLSAQSASFDKLNWQKWLMVNFKINRLPDSHIVDRYLKSVEQLGVKNDGAGLDFFIPEAAHFPIQKSSVVIAIGAAHATKRLPTDRLIELCQTISEHTYLIGGTTEQETGEMIAQKCGNVNNLCGKLNIDQSASVIKQAKYVITHDTGMMHIAAALKKKIVSIWGNTIPDFGMYPYYPEGMNLNTSLEVNDLSCRPCSKIGHQSCPKGHFKCMNELDLTKIVVL